MHAVKKYMISFKKNVNNLYMSTKKLVTLECALLKIIYLKKFCYNRFCYNNNRVKIIFNILYILLNKIP